MDVTVLLPDLKRVAGSTLITRWLLRGDHAPGGAAGKDVLLRECFQFIGTSLPTAALTRSLDADDAAIFQWLRADPAFVMADAVTLRLLACGKMDLSTKEVDALAATLKPLFGDSGFLLEATHPERWYLRCAREAKLPIFSSPDDALGDDLARHLPQGEDARRWRTLLNEVQMTLHDHPVNIARARRGLSPVNSLWIWGGGVLPGWVKSRFDALYSDDEAAIALASLAKIAIIHRTHQALFPTGSMSRQVESSSQPVTDTQTANSSSRRRPATIEEISEQTASKPRSILVDLTRERDLSMLEQHAFAPIDALLSRRKADQVTLLFESGQRATIKFWHRWRFWRRLVKARA